RHTSSKRDWSSDVCSSDLISTSANTYRFIVTADHGFIYKRDKIAESDKIEGIKGKTSFINRRFVVAQEPVSKDGIASMEMSKVRSEERRVGKEWSTRKSIE